MTVNHCSAETTFFCFPLSTILFDEIMCIEGCEITSCGIKGLENPLFQLKRFYGSYFRNTSC